MEKEIKVGDIVTPKESPKLKDEVKKIGRFAGEVVYILKNGTIFTKNELEPKKIKNNGKRKV